jgi:hypothetical protein
MTEREHVALFVDQHRREMLVVLDDDGWRRLQSVGDEPSTGWAEGRVEPDSYELNCRSGPRVTVS